MISLGIRKGEILAARFVHSTVPTVSFSARPRRQCFRFFNAEMQFTPPGAPLVGMGPPTHWGVILRFPSPSLPLFRKRNRMTTIARVVCMQHRIMRRFFHPQDTRPRIDVVTPIPSPRFYYTDRTIFFPIYSRTEDFPSQMPAPYEAAPPPAGGAPTRAV